MSFISIAFAIFFTGVFILYWSLKDKPVVWQNLLLLTAGYIFYAWWDYRFLSLLLISTTIDYIAGLKMSQTEDANRRKIYLSASLIVNLGILGFFKYFNFFTESFADFLTGIGVKVSFSTLNIILPIGISFYTFKTLSYTIGIYRRKHPPESNFINYALFVSFFPQLLAGPIERPVNLLPQIGSRRKLEVERIKDGLRQILWGVFKKAVIADNLARFVDTAFGDYQNQGGAVLITGVFFFAIQVYCDFSGYSDIAIGIARMLGFTSMRNFANPYFSRDAGEFWRRWHISLSTWFRDYIFYPLGGAMGNKFKQIRNVLITFTVSGLWHGAGWNFIFWGFLNGAYFLPVIITGKQVVSSRTAGEGRIFPTMKEFLQIASTFIMMLFAWIFFRAESLASAFSYISTIFVNDFLIKQIKPAHNFHLFLCILLLTVEWFQRRKTHGLEISKLPLKLRWIIYIVVTLSIIILGNFNKVEFLYFQF